MFKQIFQNIIKFLFNFLVHKRYIIIIFDLSLCITTLWLSFFLRLDIFYRLSEIPLIPLLTSTMTLFLLILFFGIHKSINRFSGLDTFIQLSKALMIYCIVFFAIFTLNSFEGVPRTIGIIQPILLSFGILSSRALIRYFFIKLIINKRKINVTETCLVYGAGAAGRQLVKIIGESNKIKCVGFLDDNIALKGVSINNLTVYNPSDLKFLRDKYKVNLVFLAIPSLNIHQKVKILSYIQKLDIKIRTLPNFDELTSGNLNTTNISSLDINGLLGRSPVDLTYLSSNTNIKNKKVIVTGGGGSIGSELCRQISQLLPKILIIIEFNEFSLYSIQQEIENYELKKKLKIIPILISVLDKNNLERIFKKYKPDTVFHAAAYKHVKIVEENPITGIYNNVFGTLNITELSIKYQVSNFLLISTDKAVRPSNIMGVSKRLSELIVQAREKNTNTKFSIVRFGNVLGSSGSVVPKFYNQIKLGGPVTLTHPKVTRFFMTINEAVSLVIKSSMIAKGGEVFVLNMGDPVRIVDLAKKMIELSGKTVKDKENTNGDIEIKIIGLGKGEKLYEELLIGENPVKTEQEKILIAQESFIIWNKLSKYLMRLEKALNENNIDLVKKLFVSIDTSYKNH